MAQTDSQVGERPAARDDEGSAGLWMFGALAQSDDESSRGSLLSFGYGVGRSTWLSAAFTNSTSPAQRADLSTDALVLALDHRFENFGFGFEFEDWGESGAVESQDFGASLTWYGERIEVLLGMERRAIDITFALTILDQVFTRKVAVDADGLSLGLRMNAGDRVRLFYDFENFGYSRDLTVLPRIQNLNRLNGSALTLANSFIDDRHTLGADIEFGEKLLTLSLSEDSSAVDGADLTSIAAALVVPVGLRVDLELSLGRSDSGTLASGTWLGVGVLVYGGVR